MPRLRVHESTSRPTPFARSTSNPLRDSWPLCVLYEEMTVSAEVNLKGITFTVSDAKAALTSAADLTRRRDGVTFATNASFNDGFAGLTLPLKSYKYSCI